MAQFPLPKTSDRTVFLGDTGAGKSTLLERLAVYYADVLYLDYKGDLEPMVPYTLSNDLRKAWKIRGHVLIRPMESQETVQWLDWFLRMVFKKRRNVIVIIDETYLTGGMHAAAYPPFITKIAAAGRALDIGLWVGVQRPKFAPTSLWSLATIWYIFPVEEEDLKALQGWLPPAALEGVRDLNYDYGFLTVQKVRGGRKVVQRWSAIDV